MGDPSVIVMCGGRGTRLWPLSRMATPKYLIEIGEQGSLLDMTLRRATLLSDPERVVVVTSQEHEAQTSAAAARLGITTIVAEPSPRDTTAAALLGVREIERRWGSSRVFSLPADHEVSDQGKWLRAMQAAASAGPDVIATVGIRPTGPSVEYGYIETPGIEGTRLRVVRFHEKPAVELAQKYVAERRFLWNTAMMSFTTRGFIDALGIASRDVVDAVDAAGIPGDLDASLWSAVRSVALEHSLMEPAAAAGIVEVVPAAFGWRDLGSWAELAPMLSRPSQVMSTEPHTHLVLTPGVEARRYFNAGIPGLIIVDTGDAVLVTTASSSSMVKNLVGLVQTAGWTELL